MFSAALRHPNQPVFKLLAAAVVASLLMVGLTVATAPAPAAQAAGTNLAGDGGFSKDAPYENWYVAFTRQGNALFSSLPTSEPFSSTPYKVFKTRDVYNRGGREQGFSGNSTLTGGLFDEVDGVNTDTGLEYVLQEGNPENPIVGELTSPLVAGNEYHFAFDLSTRNNTPSGKDYYVLLFNFTTGLPEEFLKRAPINTLPGPGDTPSYTTIAGTFTADSSADYALLFYVPHGGPGDDILIDRVAVAPIALKPEISLVKSSTYAGSGAVGDNVDYKFTVTNTGQVPLTGISVDDPTLGLTDLAVSPSTLAPGGTGTASATYKLTQADIDRGSIKNTATVTGLSPDKVKVSATSQVTTTIPRNPALTVAKSSALDTDANVGEKVTYSFLVTNTGNVSLTGVGVNESAFSGTGTPPDASCPSTNLAAGAEMTCTAKYTLTQADVDAGELTNTATATGTPPAGPAVTSPPDNDKLTLPAAPMISLAKTASPTTVDSANDVVTYSFVVANAGNVSLSNPVVTETAFNGTGTSPTPVCPADTVLAPGQSVTCTAKYSVTQADVDRGTLTNTATATATPPGATEAPVSQPSSATVTITERASLSISKSADPIGADSYTAGHVIDYSFVAMNTGNVTLTSVTVTETNFSGTGTMPPPDCPASTLAPGAEMVCTSSYTLTQADIDSGSLSNSAKATGTPPSGTPIDSPPSTVTIPADSAPAIKMVKSAKPASVNSVGDVVTYNFRVTNTGNVTLTDPTVTETDFSGTGTAPVPVCPANTSLLPGQSVTCTAKYAVTQADIDAGSIRNTAKATATPPGTAKPPVSDPSSATVTANTNAAITVQKSAALKGAAVAGKKVTYSFLVKNTGNTTLSNVFVTEGNFSGTGGVITPACPSSSLAGGASMTCTATYNLTQADVDAGKLTNKATSTGTPPAGPPMTSPPDENELTLTPAPALTMVKSADLKGKEMEVGQVIEYRFVITNTGNVTLTDASVIEGTFSGAGAMSEIICPAEASALAPQRQATCTASYTVEQADVDAGSISNTATATGTPPGTTLPPVSPPSTVVVSGPLNPSLALVKTTDTATAHRAGQTIVYTFTLTNTGNVTLRSPAVQETQFTGASDLSAVECPEETATLLPGEVLVCTASYVVVTADLTGDTLSNTATATAIPPGSSAVTTSPSTVNVKTVAPPGGSLALTGGTAETSVVLATSAAVLIASGTLLSVIRRRHQART